MMLTKDEGRKNLSSIIEMFKKWEKESERLENESDAKTLIRELFERVLGWDKSDIYEERTTGPTPKRADFQFKDRGITKLILEAKAIGVILDGQKVSQAIGYGWSSNKDYVVLTNFQTIMLFNAKWKDKNKKIFEINIEDCQKFSDKFDLLWKLSKESFSTGEIDRFSIDIGKQWKKVQIQTIDKQLLNDLKKWRETLSKDIKALNQLSENDIDEVIQKIINRLIFIRVCEDRHLEPGLSDLKSHLNLWKKKRNESATGFESLLEHLLFVFHYYDKTYDGTIFQKDDLCEKIKINDNVLEKIIEQLYVAEDVGVEYNFASIDADVLGYVYEEYLGYLLKGKKITESHTHRKEQGIYYTPTYIVDYIVRNTLGEVLKQNKEIDKIKVLDPACGSGSFLIKAFDVISEFYKEKIGEEKFDRQIKNNILTQNIYGVDLDSKAVEIAQLNLFLKIGEKGELPKLRENIKNGNSLIDDEKISDNAFLWNREFEDIMKDGGFDVIIGNPPYVDIKQLDPKIVKYLFGKYSTTENRMNLYSTFIEKALSLLKNGGYFGFIIPNSILYNESYKRLRDLLLNSTTLKKIIRLPDNVFEGVKVETIILIYQKKRTDSSEKCEVIIYPREAKISHIDEKDSNGEVLYFSQNNWNKDQKVINISTNTLNERIIKNIENESIPLVKLCDFSLGLTPYDKYKGHTKKQIEGRAFHSTTKKDNTFKPLLSGENIERYNIFWDKKEYISYGDWLGAPREQRFFTGHRIIVRQIVSGKPPRIYAGYTEEELYNTQIGFNIIVKDENVVLTKYILAILNSRLMNFYHKEKYLDPSKTLFQKILIANAKKFPIKIISITEQKNIVKLVDKMLSLNKRLNEIEDKKMIEREKLEEEIKRTDKEADELIYKIYNISEEEKKIIEHAE